MRTDRRSTTRCAPTRWSSAVASARTRRTSLVIALHGRFGVGAGQAQLSGLTALAKREGFTVVFPDGVDRSWHDARDFGPAAEQGVDDVAFLSQLIDAFVARGADPQRVFVLGMSNGGFMFAQKNGCSADPHVEHLPDVDATDGTRVARWQWTGCQAHADVELYVIEGGGHTWPGGWQYLPPRLVGRTSRDLDASEAAWRFFEAHAH